MAFLTGFLALIVVVVLGYAYANDDGAAGLLTSLIGNVIGALPQSEPVEKALSAVGAFGNYKEDIRKLLVAIRHTWILLKRAFILPARVREAPEAVGKLLGIMDAIGLDKRLSNFGIKDRDLKDIVKNGFNPDRVKNNPRALTADALEALLRGIL